MKGIKNSVRNEKIITSSLKNNMSSFNYFLSKGFTPISKVTTIDGLDTISVWTPVTGNRAFITNVVCSAGAVGATIAFYFDTTTAYKIAEFAVGGSITISPDIGGWESTVVSGRIFARVSNSATNGMRVN